MVKEILNPFAIAEALKKLSPESPPLAVLETLVSRYPQERFSLVHVDKEGDEGTRDGRLLAQDGEQIAESYSDWIKGKTREGDRVHDLWQEHKDSGWVATELLCQDIIIVAPFGPEPEDFFQIEIEKRSERVKGLLFNPAPYWPIEDQADLEISIERGECAGIPLRPSFFVLRRLLNFRSFMKKMVEDDRAERQAKLPEMRKRIVTRTNIFLDGSPQEVVSIPFLELRPDWLTAPSPCERFLLDWKSSSPGRSGMKICLFWWFSTFDYESDFSRRNVGFTPVWTDQAGAKDLPELIIEEEMSPLAAVQALLEFDQKAGYPFAWFFFALHGNRICGYPMQKVDEAMRMGVHVMPPHDEEVVRKAVEWSYGF